MYFASENDQISFEAKLWNFIMSRKWDDVSIIQDKFCVEGLLYIALRQLSIDGHKAHKFTLQDNVMLILKRKLKLNREETEILAYFIYNNILDEIDKIWKPKMNSLSYSVFQLSLQETGWTPNLEPFEDIVNTMIDHLYTDLIFRLSDELELYHKNIFEVCRDRLSKFIFTLFKGTKKSLFSRRSYE